MLPFDHDVVATCRRADARRLADAHRAAGPAGSPPARSHHLRTQVGHLLVRAGHRLQAPNGHRALGRVA